MNGCDIIACSERLFFVIDGFVILSSFSLSSDNGFLPSLVTHNSTEGRLVCYSSDLSDSTIISDDALFGSPSLKLCLSDVRVHNMTRECNGIAQCVENYSETQLIGTSFSYIENGLDGTLFSKFSITRQFRAINCSFTHMHRSQDITWNDQHVISSDSLFVDSHFIDCTSEPSGGVFLVIFPSDTDPSSIKLTVAKCLFSHCHSNVDGGVLFVEPPKQDGSKFILVCHYSNFTDCTAGEDGSLFCITAGKFSSEIKMTECRINLNKNTSDSSYFCLNSTSFYADDLILLENTNCTTEAFKISHSNISWQCFRIKIQSSRKSMFDLSSCPSLTFLNCSFLLDSTSAANIFSNSLETTALTTFIDNVLYLPNPQGNGYVFTTTTSTPLLETMLQTCADLSQLSTHSPVLISNNDTRSTIDIPRGTLSLYLSSSGSDDLFCGTYVSPCYAVSFVLTSLTQRTPFFMYILDNTTVTTPVQLSALCIAILSHSDTGRSTIRQSDDSESGPFFLSSPAEVYLKDLNIEIVNSSTTSFFQLGFSEIIFENIYFFWSCVKSDIFTLMNRTEVSSLRYHSLRLKLYNQTFTDIFIFSVNETSLSIKESVLDNIVLSGNSKIFNETTPNMVECVFSSVQVEDKRIEHMLPYKLERERSITDCQFISCFIPHGHLICLMESATLVVTGCRFKDNVGCNTGGICILSGSVESGLNLALDNCFFTGNRAFMVEGEVIIDKFGNDISRIVDNLTISFNNVRLASAFPCLRGFRMTDFGISEPNPFYVNTVGEDTQTCGSSEKEPCKTLVFTLNLFNRYERNDTLITFNPVGFFRDIDVKCVNLNVVMEGMKHTMLELPDLDEIMFEVVNSSFKLREVVLHVDNPENGLFIRNLKSTVVVEKASFEIRFDESDQGQLLNNPLFESISGSFNFSEVYLDGRDGMGVVSSLIKTDGTKTTVTNCEFAGLSLQNETSSLLDCRLTETGTLNVANNTFRNITIPSSSNAQSYPSLFQVYLSSNASEQINFGNITFKDVEGLENFGSIILIHTNNNNMTYSNTSFPSPYHGIPWSSYAEIVTIDDRIEVNPKNRK
ncbi:hypothetical protein BLNAU_16672 [Blattamonas nauphoetae]|uniref:Right handed beta helix domain-containing protein n=1 Tax=Blattamonas nauphoetae TaxID=2049346 RepID=A0ABQ9XCP1_9EUKA|nr:hypothetical protein BLNAU_16672 [Blattamonas nauphoetae]